MKIEKLAPLLGTWKTEGIVEETPFGPEGKLKGKDSYFLTGHEDFITHTVDAKMAGQVVQSSEIISYDPQKKNFIVMGFQQGEFQGIQHADLKGLNWTIDGDHMRFKGKFNKDFSELSGEWQYRENTKWKLWMTLTLTRREKK